MAAPRFIDENCLPPTTLVCNCAMCNLLLLGESQRELYRALGRKEQRHWPPLVRGRVLGRPYCGTCLPIMIHDGGIRDG